MGRRGDGSGGPQKQEIHLCSFTWQEVETVDVLQWGLQWWRSRGGAAAPVSEQAEHRSQETSPQTENTNKG